MKTSERLFIAFILTFGSLAVFGVGLFALIVLLAEPILAGLIVVVFAVSWLVAPMIDKWDLP